MKRRLKQLNTLLEYYQQAEHIAAKLLADAINKSNMAKKHLHQLTDYQNYYQQQFSELQQTNACNIQNRSKFSASMRYAIENHANIFKLLEQQQQVQQLFWQQANAKVKSIALLIEKIQKKQLAIISKQEQKDLDEWVMGSLSRKQQQ